MAHDFYKPNRPLVPCAQPQHGEQLFEFVHGHDRYRCELRDYGHIFGVGAQLWRNEDFVCGRRFDARMDPTRTPRDRAIAWAEEERKAIEVSLTDDLLLDAS